MITAPPREKSDSAARVTGAESLTRELSRTLGRIGVVRGITAFALGAYIFVQEPASAAVVARMSAAYWIVDGLAALRAARFADALALSRMVFLLRGGIALASGVIVLGLPLGVVFGPWQPGQGLLFVLVTAVMLGAVGCQLGAGAFDVLIWLALRRRVAGGWSWMLGGAFSAALAVVAASIFVVPAVVVGRFASIAAMVAAFGFVVGAVTAGDHRTARVVPLHSRKH